jgi:hypothetical protein
LQQLSLGSYQTRRNKETSSLPLKKLPNMSSDERRNRLWRWKLIDQRQKACAIESTHTSRE